MGALGLGISLQVSPVVLSGAAAYASAIVAKTLITHLSVVEATAARACSIGCTAVRLGTFFPLRFGWATWLFFDLLCFWHLIFDCFLWLN